MVEFKGLSLWHQIATKKCCYSKQFPPTANYRSALIFKKAVAKITCIFEKICWPFSYEKEIQHCWKGRKAWFKSLEFASVERRRFWNFPRCVILYWLQGVFNKNDKKLCEILSLTKWKIQRETIIIIHLLSTRLICDEKRITVRLCLEKNTSQQPNFASAWKFHSIFIRHFMAMLGLSLCSKVVVFRGF